MQTDSYQYFVLQLGHSIQKARLASGLMQQDAATEIGLSRVAIGYIEQGRRSPRVETLYAFAKLYDVDIRTFFNFLDDA